MPYTTLARCASIPLVALLLAGCPQPQNPGGDSRVSAVIGITSTTGVAPLAVTVTGVNSRSTFPGTLTYAWNFDDGATGSGVQATHTFDSAGLFRIKLTVTDAGGATGVTTVDVRVQGGDTVAVISADQTSGPAPLTVQFDATKSVAKDDTIRDYDWDFDDGTTSVQPKPQHTFRFAGSYDVALTIRTAGGIEASTTTTITVGATDESSLQFDGSSSANLPFGSGRSLTEYAVETWLKPQSEGGVILSMGAAAALEVAPATNLIRLRVSGQSFDFTASGLADAWRHVAVVVANTAGADPNAPATRTATVYLDAAPLGTVTLASATHTVSALIIGSGLRGKLGEVRVWSAARSQSQISAARSTRVTAATSGLIGVWPLNDGAGQTLDNAVGSSNGYLGSSTGVDSADPAWSSDAPPL